MIKKLFTFLLCIVFLLNAANLLAQIQFSINPSATSIGKEDVLQVSYEISGVADANFQPPLFPRWKILSGPNYSSEQTMINGKTEKKVDFIFVLQPTTTGTINLPEATIIIDNKKYTAKSISINIKSTAHVAGVSTPSNSLQLPGNILQEDILGETEIDKTSILKPGESIATKIKKNLFVKIAANKQTCFIGEPILVTYKLYTRLRSQSKVVKQPAFSGCTVYEMTESDGSPHVEKFEGSDYRVYTVRKLQLIPLQTGELKLDITSVENEITFYNSEKEAMYGNGSTQKVTVSNDPMSVHVNALPINTKTKDSNIAIGKFFISSTVSKQIDTAGDNNSLQITIQGSGNFQSVECPVIQWPSNIEHFEASSKDEINKLVFPSDGSRTFTISFIAKQKGKLIIPPIAFTFFNADTREYKTIYSDTINIDVAPAQKTNIDISKLTGDATNKKYIWIVAAIAILAGFSWWWKYGKTNEQEISNNAVSKPVVIEPEIKPEIISVNYQYELNQLLMIETDKEFFIKAKELITQFIIKHSNKKMRGENIIHQCNEGLYSPASVITKDEIFKQLEELIA
jgi:hypothetical protein